MESASFKASLRFLVVSTNRAVFFAGSFSCETYSLGSMLRSVIFGISHTAYGLELEARRGFGVCLGLFSRLQQVGT